MKTMTIKKIAAIQQKYLRFDKYEENFPALIQKEEVVQNKYANVNGVLKKHSCANRLVL